MAYLEHKAIVCPQCGHKGTINIVVGVGPGTQPGDKPYRRYRDPDSFVEETDSGRKTGRLLCPRDNTEVWANQAGEKATQ